MTHTTPHPVLRPSRRAFACACLVLLAMLSLGCIEERVVRQAFSDLPIDPHGPQPFTDMLSHQREREARELWTIPLDRFEGRGAHYEAQQRLRELREHAQFSQLWIEDTGAEAVIYHGRFRNRDSDGARTALQYTRDLIIDGERPFRRVNIVPLDTSSDQRVRDPYDLQQYHSYYSLQIAAYDDTHSRDRFDAAEDRVADLRDEGHDAYFYHGPHRSMVTVGLFHREEAFNVVSNPLSQRGHVDAYSDAVRELQREFPHHIVNNISLIDATEGEIDQETRTLLIRVP